MTISKLRLWATQPTTIHGFGVIALAMVGAAAHFSGANPTISIILGGVAYVLMHMGINETRQSTDLQSVIFDAATAIMAKRVQSAMPTLIQEALGVVGDFASQTTPSVVIAAPSAPTNITINPVAEPSFGPATPVVVAVTPVTAAAASA